MKKIKFRGKCLDNGNLVFGHFWQSETFGATVNGVVVDSKTVAQFVGYDKNGTEIYSDDEIRVYFEGAYGVGPFSQIEEADDCFTFDDIGATFDNVEVVEE